jgi:hypothetical protein
VALIDMLYLETGNEKFKMAAAKPEVHVSQLPYNYKTAKKFILFSGSGNSIMLSKARCRSKSVTSDYYMLYSLL